MPRSDNALSREDTHIAAVRDRLSTAVIGDVLDSLGRLNQFLPQAIGIVGRGQVMAGRAMPVLIGDIFTPPQVPFGRLIEAVDQIERNEIYVARGGRSACAAWGELLTTVIRERGASGAVLDGYHRDTAQILQQDLPVFSRGAYGRDAAVRAVVLDFRVTIKIGQVDIRPGDLIVGDQDGVIAIPREVEQEVIERALAKAKAENQFRQAISRGMSAKDAFATFKVM